MREIASLFPENEALDGRKGAYDPPERVLELMWNCPEILKILKIEKTTANHFRTTENHCRTTHLSLTLVFQCFVRQP